jgi:hypothetical protein
MGSNRIWIYRRAPIHKDFILVEPKKNLRKMRQVDPIWVLFLHGDNRRISASNVERAVAIMLDCHSARRI